MEQSVAGDGLAVSGRGIEALRTTRHWALVVGIVIAIAWLFGLISLVLITVTSYASRLSPPERASFLITSYGFGVLGLIVNGLLAWFTFEYSRYLGRALAGNEAASFESALWRQRRFWTTCGILAIIYVALFLLGMAAAIALPLIEHMHYQ